MISAKTHGIGSNFPGQSLAIVRPGEPGGARAAPTRRACDSPERRAPRVKALVERLPARFGDLVQEPLRDGRVGVDAAVAQERPVAADLFHAPSDRPRRSESLPDRASLRQHAAERISQKNEPPQNSRPGPGADCLARRRSRAHAIHRRDINAVGDRVRALDRSATHRAAPRRTRPSPPDASRSPWDRTARSRPAAR